MCVLGTLLTAPPPYPRTSLGDLSLKENFSDLPKAVAGSSFESKFLRLHSADLWLPAQQDDSLGLNGLCKHIT